MKLVLVAGAGCNKGMYASMSDEVLKVFNSFHIITPLGNSLESAALKVKKELDDIKDDYILLGHCYGGLVCIKLLGKFNYKSEYIKGFVLCNSHYDFTHLTLNSPVEGHERHEDYVKEYPWISENFKHVLDSKVTNKQLKIAMNSNLKEDLKNTALKNKVYIICAENDGYFSKDKSYEMISTLSDDDEIFDSDWCWSSVKSKHLGIITNTNEYIEKIKTLFL